jgi:hypothetical protein
VWFQTFHAEIRRMAARAGKRTVFGTMPSRSPPTKVFHYGEPAAMFSTGSCCDR